MQFEWDENKNQANQIKHDLSFETAALVFRDLYLLSTIDTRFKYNEERWKSIGAIENTIISVAHTIILENPHEQEIIRIITARTATPSEKRRYYANYESFKGT